MIPVSTDTWDAGTAGTCGTGGQGCPQGRKAPSHICTGVWGHWGHPSAGHQFLGYSSWSAVPKDPLCPDTGCGDTRDTRHRGMGTPSAWILHVRGGPKSHEHGHMGDTRDTLVLAATPKPGHMGQWDIGDTWHRGMGTPLACLLGAQGGPESSQRRDMRTPSPWSSAARTSRVLTRRTGEHQGTVATPLSWSSAPGDPLGPSTWVTGTPGTCDSREGGQFRDLGDTGGPWGHGNVPVASPC